MPAGPVHGVRTNAEINIGLAMAVDGWRRGAGDSQCRPPALGEIAVQRRDLAERARGGKLRPADIAGGTFTISNLGMFGVDAFTAIIIPPQAAILAVGAIADRVVPVERHSRIRPMMTLTLSSDHRVVDGARAAEFLRDLAEAIGNPQPWLGDRGLDPVLKSPAGISVASIKISVRVFAAPLLICWRFSLPAVAQGGPPFIGDDPGTPGDGNWEVNVAAYAERHPNERIYNAPILDANYGWGPRIQLKYQVPYLVDGTDGGPTRSGLGKSLAGVKWRFYDSGEDGLQISTYPQLEFNNPTSSLSLRRGLVDGGTRFYLPIELTKKVGPFVINPEVGYWFADKAGAAWADWNCGGPGRQQAA